MAGYERRLLVASRTAREDAVSRYLLPIVEEFATEKLMETGVRPAWLVQAALVDDGRRRILLHPRLALGGAGAADPVDSARPGRAAAGDAAAAAAEPVDALAAAAVAGRRPGAARARLVRGEARLGLGRDDGRARRCAFAEAGRVERAGRSVPGGEWHFSRRTAIWLALPFAIGGWWSAYLGLVALYAATSFFIVQHLRHGVERD